MNKEYPNSSFPEIPNSSELGSRQIKPIELDDQHIFNRFPKIIGEPIVDLNSRPYPEVNHPSEMDLRHHEQDRQEINAESNFNNELTP